MLGLLRSIEQRLELLGRFRNIMRHARQAEVVELPTSYGALRGTRERVRQNAKTPRAARPGEAAFAFVGPSGLNPDGAFLARCVVALSARVFAAAPPVRSFFNTCGPRREYPSPPGGKTVHCERPGLPAGPAPRIARRSRVDLVFCSS